MPHIPRAICVPCAKEYRVKKNGYDVLMTANGTPYYQVSADLWECPVCGHQVVLGFAQAPYWRNYHDTEPPTPNLTATFA